ncbi:F-box domain protein [Aspergillus ellipticus CBS 707.79]|uniref:F-box domain protein n=1 Tax=Aspergillus ellipticus CBS 707.79 TaxID=1448320 RepID=A0A319DWH3_9EURO|nr:F-box domain protein [Aspergillus ellipticus CBS 707.79]
MAGSSSLYLGDRGVPDLDGLSDDDDDEEEQFLSSASTTSAGSEDRAAKLSELEESTKTDVPSRAATMTPISTAAMDQNVSSGIDRSVPSGNDGPTTKTPLNLLDLPMDILQEIMKEVTHTNDLTSLALTCSALHGLAIPQMYSRFDIVWPDTLSSSDHPAGVDALSYGLATLVMGEDIFHELPPRRGRPCPHCGCSCPAPGQDEAETLRRVRRGNYYAQYTRKFSVGNGPLVWVQEYAVTKETGKMLGTLVALAVARMVNLETFVWDMPTGVLRDVWIALSSLANRPGHDCRLERVWVRWHDNAENAMRPLAGPPTASSVTLPETQAVASAAGHPSLGQRYGHVEYPSLSILPPLKSLSVLDIDEPSYLEEMAVLIERSRDRLKELRIGISAKAHQASWLKPAGSWQAEQPAASVVCGWPKSGGVLGAVLGREEPTPEVPSKAADGVETATGLAADTAPTGASLGPSPVSTDSINGIAVDLQNTHISESPEQVKAPRESHKTSPETLFAVSGSDRQLKLETLELERVALSIPVALHALDWTRLATLTILRCDGHEKLWRALRRQFSPSTSRSKYGRKSGSQSSSSEYQLRLKHIHTDAVSPYLLLFIKDTLAPNTLQTLFLHEAPMYDSIVHIDAIYKNAIRNHHLSLQKILVDSTQRSPSGSEMPSVRWYKWMFTRQMITFMSSGRMPRLRELSIALHSRDWHYFIQRLPYMPHLRALHIPHIARPVHRDPKELAMLILDIVTIRPEVGITYVGIQNKCYEILEAKDGDPGEFYDTDDSHSEGFVPGGEEWGGSDTNEDESEDDGGASAVDSHSELSSDDRASSDGEDSDAECNKARVSFRLREILFYDDKIAVFKARHGVL